MASTSKPRRSSSGSTVRPAISNGNGKSIRIEAPSTTTPVRATLWIHDDSFSTEQILLNESILMNSGIHEGSLVKVSSCPEDIEVRDFDGENGAQTSGLLADSSKTARSTGKSARSYLCIARLAPADMMAKQQGLEISVTKTIAGAFGFAPRSHVLLTLTDYDKWTASHVEVCFRDAYLARSDMWRFASQELVGKTIYAGQKVTFMGSLKATIKSIHLRGRRSQTAYFSGSTVPVFRSEAARYVIFIQMTRGMWDFDSDGSGEIMFNRVVNGFLPDLFKRWSELEVRHLVSIVMFGRLEYNRAEMEQGKLPGTISRSSVSSEILPQNYQDFYRVVVTDMASAQWTTILDELKRDFRTFLRDLSLFSAPAPCPEDALLEDPKPSPPRITGRLSTALKGNILEAINLAASQFSNDYMDRDLIRTGVSTVVVTAGTGVFDVDRDLLKLTSENLTNNGIGIDIVCLSKMPLHSVPLFRYRLSEQMNGKSSENGSISDNSNILSTSLKHPSLPNLSQSPAFSSATSTSNNYFARFPGAFPSKVAQPYGYGIPQWIDLSYWSPDNAKDRRHGFGSSHEMKLDSQVKDVRFVPRLRLYELQMIGVMEIGVADIAIPYLADADNISNSPRKFSSTKFSQIRLDRSLSSSPELVLRKPAISQQRSPEMLSKIRPQNLTTDRMLEEMERYDDDLFNFQPPQSHKRVKSQKAHRTREKQNRGSEKHPLLGHKKTRSQNLPVRAGTKTPPKTSESGSDTASILSIQKTKPKQPRISRNISYALRGLAPLKPAVATAEVNVENISAQPLLKAAATIGTELKASAQTANIEPSSALQSRKSQPEDAQDYATSDTRDGENQTKPISITTVHKPHDPASPTASQRRYPLDKLDDEQRSGLRERRNQISDDDDEILAEEDVHVGSVPESKIPFIRNVNASNPLKHNMGTNTFGRWQHLYPQKPRAATVKWRSLCTPASVPLTTDDFPSPDQLLSEYDSTAHVVHIPHKDELKEIPESPLKSMILEMISLRLAHGYQFVVGSGVKKVAGNSLCDTESLFQPSKLVEQGSTVFLSMGNTIQKLSFEDVTQVVVTKYVRKPLFVDQPFGAAQEYNPYIRTILSHDYQTRRIVLEGFLEEYPWEAADNHLAGGKLASSGDSISQLRYWRARFVLIPVEPPSATWKTQRPEENEEEIHLLGIRALTQMWQRNRYIPTEERKTAQARITAMKKRDPNPLEIKIETLNPSELVTTELDRMLQLEEAGEVQSTQLLPEPDKLDRESSMQKFSQAMQSDRGIEIKNRRWHLRLHYNCFHGEEFTNWLMHNVMNMDTREDAVEFGNELMKEGLFEHVNGRHAFKDGHYFYSIKSDFRTPKLDLRTSWFPTSRQPTRSIPPTPLTDQPNHTASPLTVRTRSGSNLAQQLNTATSTDSIKLFGDKKRRVVSFSRMIRVDVDPRKRSFLGRQEIVNLHYDRLHNPENCYHIELNWLSTTCKLVDEAIVSWTNIAEKYGLKLVEVPIAEAYDVPLSEPFRSAYRIKLCVDPPKRSNTANSTSTNNPVSAASNISFNNVFFTATAFGPQQTQAGNLDKHIYQKALLRRFNFVLDLEAASEFPENVDIEYSWGKLEYKYTQFVHRSGVILAQITDNGDILLLANRLYNSRLASTNLKDTTSKFDTRKDTGPHAHRPPVPPANNYLSAGGSQGGTTSMQASGIIGLNLASPNTALTAISNSGSTPSPSPRMRAFAPPSLVLSPISANQPQHNTALTPGVGPGVIADTFGTRSALISSGLYNTFITPEQIKDDLESFCNNKTLLEAFYREVAQAVPQPHPTGSRKAGHTSSSLLRPVRDNGGAGDIPAFELPESIAAATSNFNAIAARRATVAYENITEMMGREAGVVGSVVDTGGRHGSGGTIGSVGDAEMALAAVSRVRHDSPGAGNAARDSPLIFPRVDSPKP